MTRPATAPADFLKFEKLITEPLKAISTTHPKKDFYTNPSFKDSWLDEFVDDVFSGRHGLTFPLVCAQFEKDDYATRGGGKAINNKDGSVFGVVKIADSPEGTNILLAELCMDIKVALFNSSLTINSAKYTIPNGSSLFAVVEVKVTIKSNETWGEYD